MKPDRKRISSDYLCFLLNSRVGIEAIESICIESTRKRFSLADLHSLRIPIPPVSEQVVIARHVADVISQFDNLAFKVNQSIELMKERRSALISAAVTGKIDVRNMA